MFAHCAVDAQVFVNERIATFLWVSCTWINTCWCYRYLFYRVYGIL